MLIPFGMARCSCVRRLQMGLQRRRTVYVSLNTTEAHRFMDGLSRVMKNRKYGFVDKDWREAIGLNTTKLTTLQRTGCGEKDGSAISNTLGMYIPFSTLAGYAFEENGEVMRICTVRLSLSTKATNVHICRRAENLINQQKRLGGVL